MSRAGEHGILGGLAAGLNTVEKYAYQEWLAEQQLKTDQLRREAEFQFQQDTAQARRDMATADAQQAAATQAAIFNDPAQVAMRGAQNQEAIDNKIAELQQLGPEQLAFELEKEEQKQLLSLRFQEKYANEIDALEGLQGQQRQSREANLIKLWRRDLSEQLPNLSDTRVQEIATEIVTGVRPAQTGFAFGATGPMNASSQVGQAISALGQRIGQRIEADATMPGSKVNQRQWIQNKADDLAKAVTGADYEGLVNVRDELLAQIGNDPLLAQNASELLETVERAIASAGSEDQLKAFGRRGGEALMQQWLQSIMAPAQQPQGTGLAAPKAGGPQPPGGGSDAEVAAAVAESYGQPYGN